LSDGIGVHLEKNKLSFRIFQYTFRLHNIFIHATQYLTTLDQTSGS